LAVFRRARGFPSRPRAAFLLDLRSIHRTAPFS
jgi:hypothetical protein